MRRTEMFELHDHPRFPRMLRDLVTDALKALWQFGNSYKPILARLHEGIIAGGESPLKVLDLCSGGGGPWQQLARQLEEDYGCEIQVCLTDKYPNAEAFERFAAQPGGGRSKLGFVHEPVDAMRVPKAMEGFRTMFSSFHHFGPEDARAVLADAVRDRCGIGIFEVARRGPMTFLVLSVTPLLVLFLTPGMRPFRWSRLLWTYVLPVIPFVIFFDGWASCLRAYSIAELREMVRTLPGYVWEIGEERTGLLPVTYLIGVPSK